MTELISEKYISSAENDLRRLLSCANKDNEKMYEAMAYSVLNGGKRVRAFLTLAFYMACKGENDFSPALRYASAVEMIHAASLIHDDLPALDNDDYRRGKPSNHKKFGEAQAIIAGDGLYIKAFETIASNQLCSSSQNLKAVKILAEKSGPDGMNGGQMIDIESINKAIDGETLKKLDYLKTSCLISAACMLGCVAAGVGDDKIKAAEKYGDDLGLAFQIRDDIIDIEGDPEKVGKTIGKDAEANKPTYTSLYGIEQAKIACRRMTEEAIDSLSAFGDNFASSLLSDFASMLAKREA